MRAGDTGDLWWKSAVVYCADVETFQDSDGDGIGDLRGMTSRVEYLADLGVTCLWLMPFYPTAGRDDGYDITDFSAVDPRLGTLGDFVELVRTANAAGIRVVVDFVMNHTSDQHPWFRSARRSTDDPYRRFYVWSAERPDPAPEQVVFPDREDSIWEHDETTGEWYLHHFYRTQPDLNVAEPAVREEIVRTLGLWLQLGVSGFRVDAVPFLFQTDTYPGATDSGFDPMHWLVDVREFVSRRLGDAALLGEVNVPYEQQKAFFGGADGDGLNTQFDFIGMQRAYLSFAREDAGPLAEALRERPALDTTSQWANFVRNHDELTLDKLSDDERAEVFAAFGPDPDMQLYGRGLRRRLPPMVGGDDRRVRLAYSLAFSLPGTPVLFYGEEIGMGENLDVPGRLAVRTPMQWDDGPNGGFSDAAPDGVPRPVPTGAFAPERVNVAAQRQDPDSLWSFVRALVRARRQMPEIGWSQVEVLDHGEPAVLAHLCRCDEWSMLAVHNLSSSSREVELALPPSDLASPVDGTDADGGGSEAAIRLQDALPGSATEERLDSQRRVRLVLPPYAGRWLRVLRPGERSW
ncbi:MAG: alpha-amylase family protein [Phycicoccus sp.]